MKGIFRYLPGGTEEKEKNIRTAGFPIETGPKYLPNTGVERYLLHI
jgi:hypothetical protein